MGNAGGEDRGFDLLSPHEEFQFAGLIERYYVTPGSDPRHDLAEIPRPRRTMLKLGACASLSCGAVALTIWLIEHENPVLLLLGIGSAALLAALMLAGLMLAADLVECAWPRGDNHHF